MAYCVYVLLFDIMDIPINTKISISNSVGEGEMERSASLPGGTIHHPFIKFRMEITIGCRQPPSRAGEWLLLWKM